jgi:hypothetical protein
VPFNGQIIAVRLVSDQTGSIVIDIWKDSYANFPPVVADTICGAGSKPTLATARKSEDTTLSAWVVSVAAGDWLAFNVDSASAVTQVTLSPTLRRSP